MTAFDDGRRSFLARALAASGLALIGDRVLRPALAGDSAAPAAKAAPSTVWEIHFASLRGESAAVNEMALGDFVLVGAGALTGESFPLDGLADLFGDEPSAVVLVDARSGTARTRVIALKLAQSLVEIGSDQAKVTILDARDEDLRAGGYTIEKGGKGLRCHGTVPKPGYGTPAGISGANSPKVALSRTASGAEHIAVVASLAATGGPAVSSGAGEGLAAGNGSMGPFVIDAALRLLDERSRQLALRDPAAGARILASPAIGGRLAMVVGEAVDVRLGGPSEGESGSSGDPGWPADEVLVGTNLFAVERIGHKILSNTRRVRGLAPLAAHPILVAAEMAGLTGASIDAIVWKKAAL